MMCDRPASLLDIYPTLCELAGLPPLETFEGRSLVPLLNDATAEPDRVAITTHGRNNHSIRSQEFRYIRYADGSHELYNHRDDPNEWQNVVDQEQYAVVVRNLAKQLPKVNAPSVKEKTK